MTMIEKMARAMWESHPNHAPWDLRVIDTVPYMIYAKRALHVLLEPSDRMVDAGFEINDGPFETNIVFKAMVQAALDEK